MCHRYSMEDCRRLEKAFQNAPISDFNHEKLCFDLTKIDNGYTWTRVFAGCLEHEETIAVPLNMPPAVVCPHLYALTFGYFNMLLY